MRERRDCSYPAVGLCDSSTEFEASDNVQVTFDVVIIQRPELHLLCNKTSHKNSSKDDRAEKQTRAVHIHAPPLQFGVTTTGGFQVQRFRVLVSVGG